MTQPPQVWPPAGLSTPIASFTGAEAELHLDTDLRTLREIVAGLDRLEERLKV